VVIDAPGRELDASREACPPGEARGPDTGRVWVQDHCPPLPPTRSTPADVRRAFWSQWTRWKAAGATLVADCGWPVEARFLAACVDDGRPAVRGGGRSVPEGPRDFAGPYPLHELSSLRLAAGHDLRAKPPRLAGELPEHDPLADARFAARLLAEVLRGRLAASG
jgi:hypothetical protein